MEHTNSPKSTQELAEFIEAEIDKNKKTARHTWTIGLGLVVIIAGYLSWMVVSVRSMFFEPEGLANIIVGSIDGQVPVYLEQAEDYLVAQAPILAENTSTDIMQLIHTIRIQGEQAIEVAYDSIPALEGAMTDAIDAHFDMHGDDIKAIFDGHDTQEAANRIVDGLVTAVVLDISDRTSTSAGGEGLEEMKLASLKTLQKINNQLKMLIKKPSYKMTTSERMQRRLIVTWIQALKGQFQDQRLKNKYALEATNR